jgi:hypothetical protein
VFSSVSCDAFTSSAFRFSKFSMGASSIFF